MAGYILFSRVGSKLSSIALLEITFLVNGSQFGVQFRQIPVNVK
jgi:hypothetical protein